MEVDGSGRSVSGVSISGSVVTLTLGSAVEQGDTGIRVSYTPGINPIRDAVGNESQGTEQRSGSQYDRDAEHGAGDYDTGTAQCHREPDPGGAPDGQGRRRRGRGDGLGRLWVAPTRGGSSLLPVRES